jgi:hypothetical protein
MSKKILINGLVGGVVIFIWGFVSHWNWYGFPTAYALGSLVDQAVGFGLAGMVMAKMMKTSAA